MQDFEFNLEDNLLELQRQLRDKTYEVQAYTSFYVTDPKLRHIHKANVRDRVLFQAVYRVLAPLFEKEFIYDSFASRVGKGTHAGVDRLEKFLVKASANGRRPAWALKCDVRKFFDSIDHEVLFKLLYSSKVTDLDTAWLLQEVIGSYWIPAEPACPVGRYAGMTERRKKGLPLGNVTSQLFANVYLHQLDFFVKHVLRIKHYVRYCDDFVIIAQTPDMFFGYIERIRDFLQSELRLELHPRKIEIREYSQGIDFLGYVLRPHHRLLRTKTKHRILRHINNKNAVSYFGVLEHCDSHELKENIIKSGIIKSMTIYLAADHAGYKLKEELKKHLEKEQHNVIDCGAFSYDPVDDYPDYVSKAAELVSRHPENRGIVIGGSGQGEAMVANRYKDVRCAVFYGAVVPKVPIDAEGHTSSSGFEIVKLERQHNDANMLSLGARFLNKDEVFKAVKLFLETQFSPAERHLRRIRKF